jgi:hypothetical protein
MLTTDEQRALALAFACRLDEDRFGDTRWVESNELGEALPELTRLAEKGWLKRHGSRFRMTDAGIAAVHIGSSIVEAGRNVN